MISNSLKITLNSNSAHLQNIIANYEAYKADKITKGQYDHARRVAIQKLEANMGPVKRLFTRKRNYRQVLRISRKKGRPPTSNISHQINRMNQLSRLAAGSGVILAGVNLKMSCNAIGEANTVQKKNEIFAETLGGLVGGGLYGLAVSAIFFGTPVGWGVVLVVVAGGVAYGVLGKRAGRNLYDTWGRNHDLVTVSGVSRLCH